MILNDAGSISISWNKHIPPDESLVWTKDRFKRLLVTSCRATSVHLDSTVERPTIVENCSLSAMTKHIPF